MGPFSVSSPGLPRSIQLLAPLVLVSCLLLVAVAEEPSTTTTPTPAQAAPQATPSLWPLGVPPVRTPSDDCGLPPRAPTQSPGSWKCSSQRDWEWTGDLVVGPGSFIIPDSSRTNRVLVRGNLTMSAGSLISYLGVNTELTVYGCINSLKKLYYDIPIIPEDGYTYTALSQVGCVTRYGIGSNTNRNCVDLGLKSPKGCKNYMVLRVNQGTAANQLFLRFDSSTGACGNNNMMVGIVGGLGALLAVAIGIGIYVFVRRRRALKPDQHGYAPLNN